MNWLEKRVYKVRRRLAEKNQIPITEELWKDLYKKNSEWFKVDLNPDSYSVDVLVQNEEQTIAKASRLLREKGLVILKNIVPNEKALTIGKNLKEDILKLLAELGNQPFVETEHILLQMGNSKIDGYRALAAYSKPVATVRRKGKDEIDGGMFDLFGFDKFIESHPAYQEIYSIQKRGLVNKIVQKTSDVKQRQMNVYYNNEVLKTRHLHVDSVDESYKSFLYLTDVNTLDDGPYMFVPESHNRRKELFKSFMANARYNNIYNIQDIYLPYDKALPLIAPAGTIAISNQKGIHGGHPQKPNHERLLMVDSYYN
ncbi:MAG: hypothetical protein GC181_15420 [Bacteroidetes bacterium]|nr:hypothetical protein [Bacteroidota bacterium]